MSDDLTKMFGQMMAQGQAMAQAMAPHVAEMQKASMEAFGTMSKEALEAAMGKTFNPNGLDAKTRLLITLAAQTMQGVLAEEPFKVTVKNALEAGATAQEIAETIAQMAGFAGVPAMTKAMTLAQAVIAETGES